MRHFNLIRHWEGLSLHAYRDVAGVLTIGYGHTGDVHEGQMIDAAQAESLLRVDVRWAEAAIDQLVDVPINANQRSALISWVFNVGSSAAAGSTLIRQLNAGLYAAVPGQLTLWVYASSGKGGTKVVVKGLVRRRASEVALWEEPVASFAPDEPDVSIEPGPPVEPLAPLVNSRTIWASVTAFFTTVVATFKDVFADLLGLASTAASGGYGWQILNLIETAQPTVVLLAVLIVIYARIDDHRKGRR